MIVILYFVVISILLKFHILRIIMHTFFMCVRGIIIIVLNDVLMMSLCELFVFLNVIEIMLGFIIIDCHIQYFNGCFFYCFQVNIINF